MIRVLVFLLIVAAFAVGAVWMADRPGDVTIVWLGQRVETSVMVLASAVATIAALTVMIWTLVRALVRSPARMRHGWRRRRATKAQRAVSRGLVAVGSGNLPAARRFAAEARRLTPAEPLALLLTAQAAQLANDHAGAEQAFRAMTEHHDTRLIGLHGLFAEARERGDKETARLYAEEAAAQAPGLPWAAHAVLDFRAEAGDWTGALAALDASMRSGVTPKPAYRRQRAVLLTALAMNESARDMARASALEAVKLAPALVPAATMAGRFLAESGETRKAARILEGAWRSAPHPDLAAGYADLYPGDSAQARLARMRTLAKQHPQNEESVLALTRAAIDAHEFAEARAALTPLTARPTQRVALLMAELEERESGDIGRSREWMARAVHAARDPAWTADGIVSDVWLPVSPATGRLDAFEWKVPLEEFPHKGTALEGARAIVPRSDTQGVVPAALPVAASTVTPTLAQSLNGGTPPPADAIVAPATASGEPVPAEPARAAGRRLFSVQQPAADPATDALSHAPDDPGPDAAGNDGPGSDTASPHWQRMRSLFR